MKNTKGFTLVELLVVISIIALLLSILMPSLGAAREQARLLICKARLNQNGLANLMYANDYNGKTLSDIRIDSKGKVLAATAEDMTYIYETNNSAIGLAKLFRARILDHNRQSATLFYCPSIPKHNPRSADWLDFSKPPNRRMKNIDRLMARGYLYSWVPVATQTRNRWSNGNWPRGGKQELANMPGKWGFDTATDSKKSFIADPWAGYHNGKGTVWYLDGHVKTWNSKTMMTRGWYDTTYNLTWNQDSNWSYNSREILWNYGRCFDWLDGEGSAMRSVDWVD